MKTLLITGCSSGIGATCARTMKARGWRVFATARKDDDLKALEADGLEALCLDYADKASVAALADEVSRRTGGKLDALFNNGAYGQPGALEDITRELLTAQFEANVFGWHDLTRRCLPLMRANGAGRIVHCSSVLGLVALKWRGAYNASKFAVEALADTLRLELRGTGIAVSLIEPGPIRSRFLEHAMARFDATIDIDASPYRDYYRARRAKMGKGGSGKYKLGPEAVAEVLIHALENPQPKARYFVTTPTKLMALARRILPTRLLDDILDRNSG